MAQLNNSVKNYHKTWSNHNNKNSINFEEETNMNRKQFQEIQKEKKQRKEQDILVGEKDGFKGYNKWDFKELPIIKYKREILYCVENFSCIIIVAETGSGKTTKIPQYLVEAGYALGGKKIGVSQPRRIAAISIANRVASEMGCFIGHEVGYSVRFDQNYDDEITQIKYMTDGMLINEILTDPTLKDYSVLMIDDIHERTINTDILLGLLKKIRRKNPSLKLIVSSATIDAEEIGNFFNDSIFEQKTQKLLYQLNSKLLYIEGRQFPVDIFYLQQACKNYVLQAVQIAIEIIRTPNKKGDILIFLTSQEEIMAFIEILYGNFKSEQEMNSLKVLPLYSGLPLEEQMEIFKPCENYVRKIIVSTNIAESSITIDGVVFVIDTLFHKINYYDYRRGLDNLLVMPISQACAKQRAGRAGRVQRGECYRLSTKHDFQNTLFENSTPEILRCDLSSFILQIKTLGVGDVSNFELLTSPKEDAYAKSLEQLFALQIIDKQCELTSEIGLKICDFNLETKLGVLLLNSFNEQFGCSEEILILCSMLSLQGQVFYNGFDPLTILKQKKRLGAKEGDHLTLINIFLGFKSISNDQARQSFCGDHKINIKSLNLAIKIHEQLTKQVKRLGLKTQSSCDDVEGILRCLVTGFFMNIAQLQPDSSYRNLRNKEILFLHPTSILNINFPKWVLYSEVVYTSKYYMREVSEVDPKWLLELASHYFEDQRIQQAQQRHGKDIITQNQYEVEQAQRVMQIEKDQILGNSRTFKRKGGIDSSIKEGQEIIKKKMKINMPQAKFSQNKGLLSFLDEDEDEKN